MNCVLCRDCKHWRTAQPQYLANYDRATKADSGWLDGVCGKLIGGITINVSGGWNGATVDSVETDANFSCVYSERKEP